jgi:oligopeptide transport system substrate-binding protein
MLLAQIRLNAPVGHSLAALSLTVGLSACRGTLGPSAAPSPPLPDESTIPAAATATTKPAVDEPVVASIGLDRAPQTIDPGLVAPLDAAGNDLVENLFIGLTHLDPDTGRIEPSLASSWERLEDGFTWRFNLRDDVYWVSTDAATGEVIRMRLVTADDVVYAVRRACQPASEAPLGYSPGVFTVSGCRDIVETDPADYTPELLEDVLAAHAVDDQTVEFRLAADAAFFPSVLAMPMLRPVPVELVEANGLNWTQPQSIWTSGAFVLQSTIPVNEGYTLLANPHWPLPVEGNVDAVQISFTSPETAYASWQSGDLDVASVPPAQYSAVPFGDDPTYRLLARPAVSMLVFSYDVPPLDNPDVRIALSLAIDRQAVIDEVLAVNGEVGLPAMGLIPPGMALAPSSIPSGLTYNPEAARAALARAGYEDCRGLFGITIMTDQAFPISAQLAYRYVEQWEEVLGCVNAFRVEQVPLLDLYTVMRQPPVSESVERPGIMTMGWQADYPDAHHWLVDVAGCRDLFPLAYLFQARTCIAADQQLVAAASVYDDSDRATLYEQVSAAFFNADGDMPVTPIYIFARPLAINPWMEVYPLHAGAFQFDRWLVDLARQP